MTNEPIDPTFGTDMTPEKIMNMARAREGGSFVNGDPDVTELIRLYTLAAFRSGIIQERQRCLDGMDRIIGSVDGGPIRTQ